MSTGDEPIPLDLATQLVIRQLRDVAARCKKIMLDPPGGTESGRAFAASRAAQQLEAINRELDRLKGRLANVAAKSIAGAYRDGLAAGDQMARDAGVADAGSAFQGGFSGADAKRAQILAQQTVGDLSKAVDSIKATTGKVVRQTQALNLNSADVNKLLGGGTIEGAPLATLRDLKKLIRTAAIDGKIVTVNTRTGVTMDFKPDTYAELVFQTKLAETTNVATINRLRAKKMFYVKIIGSNSRNFCTAFVGRVFYTGEGNDPLGLYPNVRELPNGGPPFHPRCTKRFVAFVPALATEEEKKAGQLKPHEKQLLNKSPSEAQKSYGESTPKPTLAATPAKQPSVSTPPAKASDEPVLVGISNDEGKLSVRFEIADQQIAESASRAVQAAKKAGYKVPSTWKDNPAAFTGSNATDAMAGYSAKDDAVFINPNSNAWANAAENMRKSHAQGWSSTPDPDHPTIHEIGHYAHRHAVGIFRYTQIRQQKFTAAQRDLVILHVSRYGATKPIEFIAEVFVMKVTGRPIPADVQDLYELFGGP